MTPSTLAEASSPSAARCRARFSGPHSCKDMSEFLRATAIVGVDPAALAMKDHFSHALQFVPDSVRKALAFRAVRKAYQQKRCKAASTRTSIGMPQGSSLYVRAQAGKANHPSATSSVGDDDNDSDGCRTMMVARRARPAPQPLDATRVHPEDYATALAVAREVCESSVLFGVATSRRSATPSSCENWPASKACATR